MQTFLFKRCICMPCYCRSTEDLGLTLKTYNSLEVVALRWNVVFGDCPICTGIPGSLCFKLGQQC